MMDPNKECTENALDFQKNSEKVWQDSLTDFVKYCFLSINPFPLLLIAKSISKIYHPFFSALLEHHYKSKHLKTILHCIFYGEGIKNFFVGNHCSLSERNMKMLLQTPFQKKAKNLHT